MKVGNVLEAVREICSVKHSLALIVIQRQEAVVSKIILDYQDLLVSSFIHSFSIYCTSIGTFSGLPTWLQTTDQQIDREIGEVNNYPYE